MLKTKLFSQALVLTASFSEARKGAYRGGQGIVSSEPPSFAEADQD